MGLPVLLFFFCSRNKEDSRKDCFSLPAASEGSAIVARITRSFRNEFQDKGRRSDNDLTTWIDLGGIMLNEIKQTKDKYHMISILYEI